MAWFREHRGNWLIFVAFSGLLVALLLALFVLPELMVSPAEVQDAAARLKLQNEVRGTLVQAVGGLVLVSGAYFTARNVQLARDTRDIAREAQITERFTRAIEQLGHAKADVRLGGIYALERIARDSKRDHPQVIEVIATLVRGHPFDGEAATESGGLQGNRIRVAEPSVELQAALTVLGRRTIAFDPPDFRLYLGGVRLRSAPFLWADLRRTWFNGAELPGANFYQAHLEEADFTGATVPDANFNGATLSSARMQHARMPRSVFIGADLSDADLSNADLSGTALGGANLGATNLSGTTLVGARYDDATVWPPGFDPAAAGAVSEPAR